MNRPIKFRAWDTENNIMVDGEYWLLCDSRGEVYEYSLGKLYHQEKGKYKIMQFTNFVDANGKEIYEGDICDNFLEKTRVVIKWDSTSGGWQFDEIGVSRDDGVGRGRWEFTLGVARHCVVKGNVYENNDYHL